MSTDRMGYGVSLAGLSAWGQGAVPMTLLAARPVAGYHFTWGQCRGWCHWRFGVSSVGGRGGKGAGRRKTFSSSALASFLVRACSAASRSHVGSGLRSSFIVEFSLPAESRSRCVIIKSAPKKKMQESKTRKTKVFAPPSPNSPRFAPRHHPLSRSKLDKNTASSECRCLIKYLRVTVQP